MSNVSGGSASGLPGTPTEPVEIGEPDAQSLVPVTDVESADGCRAFLVLDDGKQIEVMLIGGFHAGEQYVAPTPLSFQPVRLSFQLEPDAVEQLRRFHDALVRAAASLVELRHSLEKIVEAERAASDKPYWRRFERKRRPR